ncbi:MAG TPA: HlyD family type I secretion periplasmic adaptor subunit [Methylophilaceae bacterium]|jgi:HlyD family type I secretion membrane fusion protein
MSLVRGFFIPTIDEDESGQATRIVRKGMIAGVVLVGSFFIWASVAPISGAVIAEGKIKIASNRKTIQHLEGGIVKEILVHDGDVVKAGQPLILLEDTKSSSDLNILTDQYDALLAKEARLVAEKTLSNTINFPAELQKPLTDKRRDLISKETALFQTKRRVLNDQLSLLGDELEHSRQAVASYQTQLDAIEQNIKYKQEQLEMREGLLQKNFIGKADVLNYKQSVTDKREQLGAQAADLNNTRAKVADLQLQVVETKSKYIQDADSDLKDTSRQLFEIVERIRPAEDSMTRRTINAPIGGQVIALKVTTVGGVINPGQPIMDIVPVSDDLVIEVKIKNTDIENIYPGQSTEVQLNAYNRRTTPMVKGTVDYVAGDTIDDPQSNTSYYPANVRIDKTELKNLEHVKLEPGMPATAYIKTHDNTLIEYLTSPLTQRMRHTFREE